MAPDTGPPEMNIIAQRSCAVVADLTSLPPAEKGPLTVVPGCVSSIYQQEGFQDRVERSRIAT